MIALLLLWIALPPLDGPAPASIWEATVDRRLTAIELPASVLGRGWRSRPGLRIDDLRQTEALDEEVREIAGRVAKQFLPLGVRSVGDYTLARTMSPANTVTVRVFVFEDADRCRAWWAKKYQFDGWEGQYRAVASDRFVAVDGLGENKRAVAFGNVWLTAHQLGKGGEHLKALDAVIAALTRK